MCKPVACTVYVVDSLTRATGEGGKKLMLHEMDRWNSNKFPSTSFAISGQINISLHTDDTPERCSRPRSAYKRCVYKLQILFAYGVIDGFHVTLFPCFHFMAALAAVVDTPEHLLLQLKCKASDALS